MFPIVLIDTAYVPELLRQYGVDATLGSSFGDEDLPAGLVTIIGHRSRQGVMATNILSTSNV